MSAAVAYANKATFTADGVLFDMVGLHDVLGL